MPRPPNRRAPRRPDRPPAVAQSSPLLRHCTGARAGTTAPQPRALSTDSADPTFQACRATIVDSVLDDPPHVPHGLLRRADAVAAGYSDAELARMVRREQLSRVRRGVYRATTEPPAVDAAARHALLVRASIPELRSASVISHVSAAAMHGLPLWGVQLDRVHVLRPPLSSGSSSKRLRLHLARLRNDDVTAVEDVPTTTVTRTVVDVARTTSFETAVVLADAALRLRLTSKERLRECCAAMGPVPGSRAAARVISFADRLSESVGESRSRVLMSRSGLPAPDLQVRVLRTDRSVVGRCDFGWEKQRTIGEFDGLVKYGRLLRPGQDAGEVLVQEKLREDELRDHRWEVARWIWADLGRPHVVQARIQRAFVRGRR
jgi:Transcriptional regulator, AbiEi antitoxin